jgi:hypothetical protein
VKFATRRVELPVDEFGTTNSDEPLWIEVPVAVKEGFAKKVRESGKDDPDGRKANAVILSLVVGWNLDDDEGAVLPLVRGLDPKKDVKQIEAVVAEVPLPLFTFVAQLVTRTEISQAVLGNSRT